jgi:hypothetical protein
MAIGEGAGVAASMAVAADGVPRDVDGEKLKAELVAKGAMRE